MGFTRYNVCKWGHGWNHPGKKKVNNMRTGERTYKASQRQVRKLGDDAQEGSFPEERLAKHNYDAGLKFSK